MCVCGWGGVEREKRERGGEEEEEEEEARGEARRGGDGVRDVCGRGVEMEGVYDVCRMLRVDGVVVVAVRN